jgi:hypothetical protein
VIFSEVGPKVDGMTSVVDALRMIQAGGTGDSQIVMQIGEAELWEMRFEIEEQNGKYRSPCLKLES